MATVGVDSGSLTANSQPKSFGLVLGRRPLGAVLHSSNEPGELSQSLCHDDSTINTDAAAEGYENVVLFNCLIIVCPMVCMDIILIYLCVSVCVRHTFCQLACRSDPSTDFYS